MEFIKEVKSLTERRNYMELLLLADEQESMIEKYMDRGEMFVLCEGEKVKAVCIVTEEEPDILEIKNLAVSAIYQRKGCGKRMIAFLIKRYQGKYRILQVGTGESPLTVPFYEKCGFRRSHKIKDFFTKYYDHPIYEGGVQLKDMIYLQIEL